MLLLLGKRRRRLRDLEALQYHGLDQDHRSAQDAGKVSLLYQLSEAQRADRMEGSMALGRGNDLAAKMFNEFVDEQSDQLVQFFGDFLLGVLKVKLCWLWWWRISQISSLWAPSGDSHYRNLARMMRSVTLSVARQ